MGNLMENKREKMFVLGMIVNNIIVFVGVFL